MLVLAAHTLSVVRALLGFAAAGVLLRGDLSLAFLLLIVAEITDWVDGPLARKAGGTRSGKLLDPLGDSVLAFVPQIGMVKAGYEPPWLFGAYVGFGVGLALARFFFLRRQERRAERVVRFFQVLGLGVAHVGIIFFLSLRVHSLASFAVALLYLAVCFLKRRRIQHFLKFLKE